MTNRKCFWSGVASLWLVALAASATWADDRTPPRPADPTKEKVEAIIKRVLAAPPAAPVPPRSLDIRKSIIEFPTEALLAGNTAAEVRKANESANPKVEPGKVRWHSTFAAACEAAKRSGKPVLLFQMMGKLDDQFC